MANQKEIAKVYKPSNCLMEPQIKFSLHLGAMHSQACTVSTGTHYETTVSP